MMSRIDPLIRKSTIDSEYMNGESDQSRGTYVRDVTSLHASPRTCMIYIVISYWLHRRGFGGHDKTEHVD